MTAHSTRNFSAYRSNGSGLRWPTGVSPIWSDLETRSAAAFVSPVPAKAAGGALMPAVLPCRISSLPNLPNFKCAETTETPEANAQLARSAGPCGLGHLLGHPETSVDQKFGVITDCSLPDAQARIQLLLPFGALWDVVAPGPTFLGCRRANANLGCRCANAKRG